VAETQHIEYKQSWRDEYLKWVCGFANAEGGRVDAFPIHDTQ
jgi:ATP-dependent DNA helicase RecG